MGVLDKVEHYLTALTEFIRSEDKRELAKRESGGYKRIPPIETAGYTTEELIALLSQTFLSSEDRWAITCAAISQVDQLKKEIKELKNENILPCDGC